MKSPLRKYSVLADARSTDVPMPYLLFSQMKMHGNFHRAAMLKDSKIWP